MKAAEYGKYLFLLWLCNGMFFNTIQSQKAIICVPVADLVGQPMPEFYGRGKVSKMYEMLSVSGIGTQPWRACPRLHQALLHEMVDIIEERGEELYIKVHNAFYIPKNTRHSIQQFWTLKSNVMPYEKIQNKPPCDATWTVLKNSLYIPNLKITLSAGTRCALAASAPTQTQISVYILNTKKHRFDIISIPKEDCMLAIPGDQRARINLFVATARAWAHQPSGIIPYVWGGCSVANVYPDGQFTVGTPSFKNKEKIYVYPGVHHTIKTGLDCSGLISRAAQLCNIPYYCKNSYTAAQVLTPLKPGEKLQSGDLIFFPGHIIIIADLQQHTLIESRSYDHGYGKVHEIPLAEQFEGIHTYDDLVQAYHNNTPLRRRDKAGNVVQLIPEFTIYTFASIFKNATHKIGLS